MELKSKIKKLQENVNLANHTTFRIGGPARYFLVAEKKEELLEVIGWAKNNKIPFFVFGGGSNLLVSDEGFNGLVIRCQILKMEDKEEGNDFWFEVGAGVPLAEVVSKSLNRGWGGLEWALGIPGTLGGAICGNAGRLGQDLSQIVSRVSILDENFDEKEIQRADCNFSYRNSRFKQRQEIILSAVLKFNRLEKEKSEELLRQAQSVVEKMPDLPCAGSVFKNYLVEENDILLKNHPEFIQKIRGGKIPAGFLIEQCGLAGKQIGGAQIWPNHANFILNINKAKASDVLKLIELCKKSVAEKFSVKIEEEIRKIGF